MKKKPPQKTTIKSTTKHKRLPSTHMRGGTDTSNEYPVTDVILKGIRDPQFRDTVRNYIEYIDDPVYHRVYRHSNLRLK